MKNEFILDKVKINESLNGNIEKSAPSNIALVKYWGKYANQIPANPSISYSLNRCYTQTKLTFRKGAFSLCVFFEGKQNDRFKERILLFFQSIIPYCPYIKEFEYSIDSQNTFPHSSGIASSASSMGALSLCIIELEKIIGYHKGEKNEENLKKRASFLARLGSGSASRSIYSGLAIWGKHEKIKKSNPFYAIAYPYKIDDIFYSFQDTILIIDQKEKIISSSLGHSLMKNHYFAKERFKQAYDNITRINDALKQGDVGLFGKIIEAEALNLHAMMMSSDPYILLMKPSSLAVIEKVWAYRREKHKNIYFSLDAGANIHLLYPESEKKEIRNFIYDHLISFCQEGKLIEDFTDKKPH